MSRILLTALLLATSVANAAHHTGWTPKEMGMGNIYQIPNQNLQLPESYYFYSGFNHQVQSIFKNSFELNDGSSFNVAYNDQVILGKWQLHDVIVFFPADTLSSYQMRAYNLQTNTSVKITLKQGPYLDSPQIKRVIKMDINQLAVRLSDGSIWSIWDGDFGRFKDWLEGDVIMTGCNNSGQGGEAILFNVTLRDPERKYVFATFQSY